MYVWYDLGQLDAFPRVNLAGHCAGVVYLLVLGRERHAKHGLHILVLAEYAFLLLQRVADKRPERDLLDATRDQRVILEQVELQVEHALLVTVGLGKHLAFTPVPHNYSRVLIDATRRQSLRANNQIKHINM